MMRGATILILVLAATAARAQWVIFDDSTEAIARRGIAQIYRLEYDSAQRTLDSIVRRLPRHPAGYFFAAMVDWWRIAVNFDDEQYDKRFLARIERTVEVCDARLDSNEYDVVALFFKGGAIGFRSQLRAYREQWLAAADDGREAYGTLQKAEQAAPTNYDIMLGSGIYNYFAEVIPELYPVVRPLMVFFPSGNKRLGITQLRAASERARYASIEASVVLFRVYYTYEKDFPNALAVALKLQAVYPENPVFLKYLGRAYAQIGMGMQWDSTWRVVLDGCRRHRTGFDASSEREAAYYVASYHMNMGRLDSALALFYRSDELSRALDTDGPSGFMVMLNLKIGQIYDLQKKRDLAIMQYDKILSWKEYLNSHAQGAQFKQHAYGQ